jgi:hypothetical protein
MKLIHFALAYGVAVATPAAAQTVDPLQSTELIKKVINLPGTAWTSYGAGLTTKAMKDPDLPGGEFIRATVSQKGAHPWDAAAAYEVRKPIKAGDVVFFAVYLRAPELKDGETVPLSGMGVGQDGPPYSAIAMSDARVSNHWGVYYAANKATANYARGQARVTLPLASDKQVIDLGPVFVLDLGADYDLNTLPRN